MGGVGQLVSRRVVSFVLRTLTLRSRTDQVENRLLNSVCPQVFPIPCLVEPTPGVAAGTGALNSPCERHVGETRRDNVKYRLLRENWDVTGTTGVVVRIDDERSGCVWQSGSPGYAILVVFFVRVWWEFWWEERGKPEFQHASKGVRSVMCLRAGEGS